jgi:hypothetical protein
MTKPRKPISKSDKPSQDRAGTVDGDLAQATNLSEIMDLIGKRATERGLTDEKLREILAESKDS